MKIEDIEKERKDAIKSYKEDIERIKDAIKRLEEGSFEKQEEILDWLCEISSAVSNMEWNNQYLKGLNDAVVIYEKKLKKEQEKKND